MQKIGLIDYGSGNFRSVKNALEFIDIHPKTISNADQISDETHLILPGVGSFRSAMDKLEKLGFIDYLQKKLINSEKYFLGVCVGHQILTTLGTEFGSHKGLDLIPGSSNIIKPTDRLFTVPHIGWNEVYHKEGSRLFKDIEQGETFYFLHSYHVTPLKPDHRSSFCNYGEEVTASIEIGNIFGVQFHPEKSQLNGLQLLRNFCELSDD